MKTFLSYAMSDDVENFPTEQISNFPPLRIVYCLIHFISYVILLNTDSCLSSAYSINSFYFYTFTLTLGFACANFAISDLESNNKNESEDDYCQICKKHVPMRTTHCSICNKCVTVKDHHSQWFGKCVGGHNYIEYISFVLMEFVLLVMMTADCIISLLRPSSLIIFLTGKLLLLVILILALLGLYIILIRIKSIHVTLSTGFSQYERKNRNTIPYMMNIKNDEEPFNLGYLGNFNYIVSSNKPDLKRNNEVPSINENEDK